jgi:hypothetical protein
MPALSQDYVQQNNLDINSIFGKFVDRGVWPYYDVPFVALTAGAGLLSPSYSLFSVPVGQADPVTGLQKNYVQTNMISSGNSVGFGSTRCLIMTGIGFQFSSFLNKANCDLIYNNAWMQFKIAEKEFYIGRLSLWPSGTGLFGVTNAGGEETWSIGMPFPDSMRSFGVQYGKYLAPLVPFNLTLFFPNLPAPPTLTFAGTPAGSLTNPTSSAICVPFMEAYLDGYTDRAVQ